MEKLKDKLQDLMAHVGIWLLKNCGKGTDTALYAALNDRSIVEIDVANGEAGVIWSADDQVSMIFGANVSVNNFQRICLTSAMDASDSMKPCRKIIQNGIKSGHIDRMNAVLGNMRGTTYPPLRTPKISDLH